MRTFLAGVLTCSILALSPGLPFYEAAAAIVDRGKASPESGRTRRSFIEPVRLEEPLATIPVVPEPLALISGVENVEFQAESAPATAPPARAPRPGGGLGGWVRALR